MRAALHSLDKADPGKAESDEWGKRHIRVEVKLALPNYAGKSSCRISISKNSAKLSNWFSLRFILPVRIQVAIFRPCYTRV